jgi:hypothetical protein
MKKLLIFLVCIFFGCASNFRQGESTGGLSIGGHYPVYNIDTTAAGAGADGTISSRNANALGECDGFIVVILSDGTTGYIPYWNDITP